MNLFTSVLWMFFGSIIVGYWFTSSILVNEPSHIKDSLTKFYLSLFMATWMVVIEVLMWSMTNKMNTLFLIPIIGVLILLSYLLRDQIGINDTQYLNAMIQHHSSAILTSQQILKKTDDQQVRDLALQIIRSQENEIDIMNRLLKS
jgi:hypothetical protein